MASRERETEGHERRCYRALCVCGAVGATRVGAIGDEVEAGLGQMAVARRLRREYLGLR